MVASNVVCSRAALITVTTMVRADAGLSVGMSVWSLHKWRVVRFNTCGNRLYCGAGTWQQYTKTYTVPATASKSVSFCRLRQVARDGTRAFFVDNAGAWIQDRWCGRCPAPHLPVETTFLLPLGGTQCWAGVCPQCGGGRCNVR